MTIEILNAKFGVPGQVNFYAGKGDLPTIGITNQHATAAITLYGAHLLSYTPAGQKDLIWMSEESLFENGNAIRGGIPLCFPWFGPHPTDKTLPQHGFARLQEWQVTETRTNEDGSTLVSLQREQNDSTLQLWPFPFSATIEFILGKTLEIKLAVTNTGNQSFEYSDALHTYFNISDISTISIDGLHGGAYYSGFEMDLQVQDAGTLHFDTETNRRYVNNLADCTIADPGYNRKIHVGKTGSKVTVVWNPGEGVTKTIADIADDGYKTFVCVEPANAYPGIDMIQLAPGEKHVLSTVISIVE